MRRDTLSARAHESRLRAASSRFRDNGFVLCFGCATLAERGVSSGYLIVPL
jgi:hypothetical protein